MRKDELEKGCGYLSIHQPVTLQLPLESSVPCRIEGKWPVTCEIKKYFMSQNPFIESRGFFIDFIGNTVHRKNATIVEKTMR